MRRAAPAAALNAARPLPADPKPGGASPAPPSLELRAGPNPIDVWGKLPRVSHGTKPQVLLPAYDAQDLRRRIPVCFTIGELSTFATKLQVPQTPGWSNNPQEAARDIVRHFERSGALAFLVEALREAKPLVEWPEPLPLPVPPAPAPVPAAAPVAPTILGLADPIPGASAAPAIAPPATPARGAPASGAGGGATLLGVPAPQALEFADTALEAPGDRPTPITDVPEAVLHAATHPSSPPAAHPAPTASAPAGFAPSMMRRPGDPPAPDASAASAPAQASETMPASLRVSPAGASPPREVRPAASAWPATHRGSGDASSSRGPDPRVLMGVGAGILLALIGVAFLAGRASSAPAGSGSGTTSGAPAPQGDHVVLSQNVVDALSTSLQRVAKACQIDPGSLRGRSLFEVAYRRCGPLPAPTAQQRTGSYDPDPSADPGQPADPDPPAPTGKKGARTTGTNKPPQRPDPSPGQPNTSGSGCLSGCSRSHGACTGRCGAEPQQGSQYDAYQSCLGGCLKALSQCKMGCQ